MYLVSTEVYKNADVHHLIEQETGIVWASQKNAQDGMGVENMSDLILKEIHGKSMLKNKTHTV